ncbi:putative aliphatic sulfonates transport permease protein SsuC [Andreprevotia sp. IGB-42]|uniref:ABC transporter permease n=1 Tax=Andreprevotia sp. IGB-42 TaxID=2497473 RepID=UPI00135C1434|nr:ABC transporter permease [Andreprevotia sp. IGB-42]KAF0815123.1 putative aliphatic sulfonates transport permease protein SsuC [Andreprevotia sp. IGB-42]
MSSFNSATASLSLQDADVAVPRSTGQPTLAARLLGAWQAAWPTLRRFLLAWPFPLAIFALWSAAAHFEWVAPQVLPSPETVFNTFGDLFNSGELRTNGVISFNRVVSGFAIGASSGLLLGVLMGLSPTFKDYVYPIFRAFAQVPSLGWLPLLMMLVGIDEALKIILVAKAALVPVALNTLKGIEGVPTRYIEVAKVYGFNQWQLLVRVVFPAAFPMIWNGVRYGLTHSWLALVAVELLASSEGLGFLIVYGRQLYQMDVVMAAVVVVGAVGFVLDKVLATIETRLLRWRHDAF